MESRVRLLMFLLWILSLVAGCSTAESGLQSLAASEQPLFSCGGDQSGRYYKSINFLIGAGGRVYLWDSVNFEGLDVYSPDGKFLFTLGKKGQGPDELPNVAAAAADSKGRLWVNVFSQKMLKVFSPDGKLIREVLLPEEISRGYINRMLFGAGDELYIQSDSGAGEYSVHGFYPEEGRTRLFHEEKGRKEGGLARFFTDLAVDDTGKLYISDPFDYRIYVYSPEGVLIRTYENRRARKERILDSDFDILNGDLNSVIRFEGYREVLARLKGPSRYFPAVFGLNVDRGRLYVWTSQRESRLNRYIVDIYDPDFQRLGRACYFNWIKMNLARIVNARLYIPSIENYDTSLVRKLGRMGLTNVPEKLNVYQIRN
ncbi:MAG: hypothetical protein NUW11_05695 [Candidatus Saccharicenans sp.]|nr:hypothetical protein [Candidatus Saccharicenans sp.]